MFIHGTLVLVLCATLVLTSSVIRTERIETDGFSKDSRRVIRAKHFDDTNDLSSTSIAPSTTNKNLKNESVPLIMGEGGPIYQADNQESSSYVSKTAMRVTDATEVIKQTSNDTSIDESKPKLPKTRNASIVPRKGAVPSSKITARKGVSLELPVSLGPTMEEAKETISQLTPREKDTSGKLIESIHVQNETGTIEQKPLVKDASTNASSAITNNNASTILHPDNNSTSSTMIKIVPTNATKLAEVATTPSNPSSKRFKPKPTVTIGEMDIDKPIPASPTKTPPLGMPRKIDYIVPVIITIMALPMLGAAAFFLYRRGRDCWDKRHYRRMDFLIDGMYNDYSWK